MNNRSHGPNLLIFFASTSVHELYKKIKLVVCPLTTEMTNQQDQQKVTFEEDDLLDKEKPLTRTVTFGRQHSCDSEKPDGGWLAWTVVASSFMISFLQEGFG